MKYTGKLQVGDLVRRRPEGARSRWGGSFLEKTINDHGVIGMVLECKMDGVPLHPCVRVYWAKSMETHMLGEVYLERIETKEEKADV